MIKTCQWIIGSTGNAHVMERCYLGDFMQHVGGIH